MPHAACWPSSIALALTTSTGPRPPPTTAPHTPKPLHPTGTPTPQASTPRPRWRPGSRSSRRCTTRAPPSTCSCGTWGARPTAVSFLAVSRGCVEGVLRCAVLHKSVDSAGTIHILPTNRHQSITAILTAHTCNRYRLQCHPTDYQPDGGAPEAPSAISIGGDWDVYTQKVWVGARIVRALRSHYSHERACKRKTARKLPLFHPSTAHQNDFPNPLIPQPPNPASAHPSPNPPTPRQINQGGPYKYPVPRAITEEDISGIVKAYAEGAKNAIAAGFDGVEVRRFGRGGEGLGGLGGRGQGEGGGSKKGGKEQKLAVSC